MSLFTEQDKLTFLRKTVEGRIKRMMEYVDNEYKMRVRDMYIKEQNGIAICKDDMAFAVRQYKNLLNNSSEKLEQLITDIIDFKLDG